MSRFERTALLLGEDAVQALSRKRVAVFGLGGVGSWCCEALGRAGIGALALIDHDTVSESNINRQLVALQSTIGQKKADVMAARLRDINPDIEITEYPVFYLPENADQIDLSGFDCIVDAIDTVTAKLHLIQTAKALGVPVISSMGTGNKLRPDLLTACDISKTTTCPLARVMRRELRARGIEHLRVVYSTEPPRKNGKEESICGRLPGWIMVIICNRLSAGQALQRALDCTATAGVALLTRQKCPKAI